MTEELKNGLEKIALRHRISYKEVLELEKNRSCTTQKECDIYRAIQSLRAKIYLKEEFGIDAERPQVPRQNQGFIYMPLRLSRKPIIR